MDREKHGKMPFPPQNKEESKDITVSTTNPASVYYVEGESKKLFAFFYTASNSRGFILGSLVTRGNVNDDILRMLDKLVT
jgi:hypothetical protein